MSLNPADDVLNPVFNFLDALISDYGDYLHLVFVWLSLAVIVWVWWVRPGVAVTVWAWRALEFKL